MNYRLGLRDVVVDLDGHTMSATQYPTVTTGWWEKQLPDGVHTWVPIVYTQTFATTALDQLASPISGKIGLGNTTATAGDGFEGEASAQVTNSATAVRMTYGAKLKLMVALGLSVILAGGSVGRW
ncbi:uncharacterized protein PV09_05068 [Verruconis gallopava]|uniref:Uncharacterized protein n=1 Tax=Verruconis gallopava TaxID=253628 RepID=A0A0D2AAG6_9PEZI|nr:uncharacterized protein PV09_05068 [Verruconis gallopava]KIW03763.1 hypothetical protein PV09_05068 [Verruconis gallopava]